MAESDIALGEIIQILEENEGNIAASSRALGIHRNTLSRRIKKEDALQAAIQKIRDLKNKENREKRSSFRRSNVIDELMGNISLALDNLSLTHYTQPHSTPVPPYAVGVIQWSDLHFNEVVKDVQGNKYDFHVAAKRLRLHVCHAIQWFKMCEINNIVIAMTGDLLNSDRRQDEALANSTCRSQACVLAADILSQAIVELNKHFNVTIACVTGNESRVSQERGRTNIMATDNYDFVIYEMLRMRFVGSEGVKFTDGDPNQQILSVAGQNLLMLHGDSTIAKNPSVAIRSVEAAWARNGVIIDYTIFGHIHEAYVSDCFARSGSLVGDNTYNRNALNISGRASQNLYVFWANGNREGYKVDLQNYDHVSGYHVEKRLLTDSEKNTNHAREVEVHAI